MVYEVLDLVQNAKSQEERVQILKDNNSLGIRDVLRAAFDDTIVFNLPKGLPQYRSFVSTDGITPTSLMRSTTQFTYFVKHGKGDTLTALKREGIFLRLLEGIDPKDAEILCAVKEKALEQKFPAITKELVRTVWPKLIAK